MRKKQVKRLVKIALLLYVVGGLCLYFGQEYLFFHPEALGRDHRYAFEQPHTEVNIPYSNQSSINVIQFQSVLKTNKGVVLYFHGNRKNIGWYARFAPYFTRQGYSVWMIDYPGYGKSTGSLSEALLYEWALQLYKLARTQYRPDQIILYGKSLGTGIAAQLASVRDCRHLLLETPYYEFRSVLRPYCSIYPLNWMIRYQFPTYQYLDAVTAPITLIHGTGDLIVRYSNAVALKKKYEKKINLVTVSGGSHNNLFGYKEVTQRLQEILNQ